MNGNQEIRSAKDISDNIKQGYGKMRKYSERVEDGNISIVPSAFLDTGKAQRAAANFMKWLCYVGIPGSRCQKNQSVAIGNAWIGKFSFLLQKRNTITIQNSIPNAKQKELGNGVNTNYEYSAEFLDLDRIANIYFISDVDAKIELEAQMSF